MRIKASVLIILAAMLAGGHGKPAQAGDFMLSIHAGQTEVDRLMRDSGPWWARVDDNAASLGISASYDIIPELAVRGLYERVNSLSAVNQCPAGAACPAVSIVESTEADLFSFTVMPKLDISPTWAVFAAAGITSWRVGSGNQLPGGSGTEFTYGAGLSWMASPSVELGLEYQRSEISHQTLRLNLGWRFGGW